MDEQHKEHAEFIFTHMSMLLTEHGAIVPTYIMIVEGQLVPIMVTPQAEMATDDYQDMVYQIAKELNPDAILFICEQWMISRPPDDPEILLLINGTMKPSEQEDKESYLTLHYKNRDGDERSLMSKIHTDPAGTKYTKDQSWIVTCVSNMIEEWVI